MDVRKPEIAGREAGGAAYCGLDRTANAHQVAISIGEDIAGGRERQDQQPFEYTTAREPVHGYQPCCRYGDGENEHACQGEHADRAEEIAGQ